MNEIYLFIVILLFVLAISDLIVGVSNDAVNFLNSAIGSKVAPRHVIMIVASLGILVGSTFSSGMMEVARKGIFNPEFFFLSEIMIIFLAVMLTDIILLDLFNTFGMPTSTTVSIVFELLGAAVAVSFLKITTAGESLSTLGDYINSSSALIIIFGIFISVLIAFAVGAFVQYISRLLFTFHLNKRMKWIGGIWSGLALSALSYFLIIKGAKGSSLISDNVLLWIIDNRFLLLIGSFIFWSALMQVLWTVFRLNILRFVVLFGTFALAMAFAGNDLVNFIGVPVAGLESFNAWRLSNMGAEEYSMGILNEPVRTKTYLLVIAGAIMVVTLWFSKKARSVTETEVNLGRQDEGTERFHPNSLAKGIVRYSISIGRGFSKIIPSNWTHMIEKNFTNGHSENKPLEANPPAFDLVRASVNLTMASVLIAFATSLKLPLSTTYVSFMVAMGTSLSDRAWGRSSAVYRIAGVINVIGGWFFTAFLAFAAAATFATFIFFFEEWAILGLVILVVFLISRTFLMHRKKEKVKKRIKEIEQNTEQLLFDGVIRESAVTMVKTLGFIRNLYSETIEALLTENMAQVKKNRAGIKELRANNAVRQDELFGMIKRIEESDLEANKVYLLMFDLEKEILQSISLIVDTCGTYVENSLKPIKKRQADILRKLESMVDEYLKQTMDYIEDIQPMDLPRILANKDAIYVELDALISEQLRLVKQKKLGRRNSILFFNIAMETKDLISVSSRLPKLVKKAKKLEIDKRASLVIGDEYSI